MKASIESVVRKSLPIVRNLQKVIKPRVANALLRGAVKRTRLSRDTRRERVEIAGVPCEWIYPAGHRSEPVLLYLHGGGFVMGITPQHLQMVEYLARKLKMRALLVDYRLAPLHPFPAALDDCTAVYIELLQQGIPAEQIAVAGDSAGGNLTITTMLRLHKSGKPLPAAGACLSPVVNLTPNANQIEGMRDPLLPPKVIDFYTTSYLGKHDPKDPLVSPVFADLSGLPPLLLQLGEEEVLRDEALKFTELAGQAGVAVRCKVYPGMWHVWQIYPGLPQAAESLDEIADFLDRYLS